MDNKIYEEAMVNMIKRIESLEEFNRNYFKNQRPPKQFQQTNTQGLATPGQAKYIKALGGNSYPEMTKAEAGKEIDRLLEIKKNKMQSEGAEIMNPIEVKEPKEVDTEDAGLDEEGLI